MAETLDRTPRTPSDALRGRARGVMIGSLIAFGWAFYASLPAMGAARVALLLIAAAITTALLVAASAMTRLARSAPDPTPEQRIRNRHVWRWFWLNLAAEILLLNLAVGLLSAPHLQIFWIPAISTVVGLHFFPMAIVFRVPSYWWVGMAMIAAAGVTTCIVAKYPADAAFWVHGEGAVNAAILWAALAAGAIAALRPSNRIRPQGQEH